MILGKGKKRRDSESGRKPQLMEGQDDVSFRRSRTMQGTTSAKVKAANEKKTELKSDRLNKQQIRRRNKLLVIALMSLLVIIFGIWYLVGQYIPAVGQVSFSPETKKVPPTEPYKLHIEEYLQGRPAERFRFALNEDNLTAFVSSKLPEVDSIVADKVNGDVEFGVTLRQPIAGWKSANGQLFVDKEGVGFVNNYFAQPGVVVSDNSGAVNPDQDNRAVVSERFLRFLGRLVALTNSSGLGTVQEASLPKNSAREVDIKIKGKTYFIKTHIDRDPAVTIQDIKRVVGYLDKKNISPSYIDVRVSGRAFYK